MFTLQGSLCHRRMNVRVSGLMPTVSEWEWRLPLTHERITMHGEGLALWIKETKRFLSTNSRLKTKVWAGGDLKTPGVNVLTVYRNVGLFYAEWLVLIFDVSVCWMKSFFLTYPFGNSQKKALGKAQTNKKNLEDEWTTHIQSGLIRFFTTSWSRSPQLDALIGANSSEYNRCASLLRSTGSRK